MWFTEGCGRKRGEAHAKDENLHTDPGLHEKQAQQEEGFEGAGVKLSLYMLWLRCGQDLELQPWSWCMCKC